MFRPNARYRLIHLVAYVFLLTMGLFVFPLSTTAQEVIHFPDLQLEAAVRRALDRPTGVLYYGRYGPVEDTEAGRQNIADLIRPGICRQPGKPEPTRTALRSSPPWRSNPPAGLEPGGIVSKI